MKHGISKVISSTTAGRASGYTVCVAFCTGLTRKIDRNKRQYEHRDSEPNKARNESLSYDFRVVVAVPGGSAREGEERGRENGKERRISSCVGSWRGAGAPVTGLVSIRGRGRVKAGVPKMIRSAQVQAFLRVRGIPVKWILSLCMRTSNFEYDQWCSANPIDDPKTQRPKGNRKARQDSAFQQLPRLIKVLTVLCAKHPVSSNFKSCPGDRVRACLLEIP